MHSSDHHRSALADDPIPARAGVGFKPQHIRDIVDGSPEIGWFEVHPENYMGAGGLPHRQLTAIRERYPISLHGVGLSIGAAGPLDKDHLKRLKSLLDRYQPALFSEHLAWSTHDGVFLNDLLPLPCTRETLRLVADHIDEVQTYLGRRMLLENPSTYVQFATSEMDEITFLGEVVKRTGCGLLLDVNNVFVSATNHDYDPVAYIDGFPVEHICEVHLAGHAETSDETGARVLIDAHDRSVIDQVWSLFERLIARRGPLPTLIEWDNDVPDWPVLLAEAHKADAVMIGRRSNRAA